MRALGKTIRIVLIGLAGLAAAASAEPAMTLTPEGLGRVRLGMTIAQAETALKAKLGRLSRSGDGFATEREATEQCWHWRRRDNVDPGVAYMVEHRVITRIDVFRPRSGIVAAVTTRAGIRIGSTEAELAKTYGAALVMGPHPISPHAKWALVERAGHAGVRVELSEGTVTSLFAARGGALAYPEGCS